MSESPENTPEQFAPTYVSKRTNEYTFKKVPKGKILSDDEKNWLCREVLQLNPLIKEWSLHTKKGLVCRSYNCKKANPPPKKATPPTPQEQLYLLKLCLLTLQ